MSSHPSPSKSTNPPPPPIVSTRFQPWTATFRIPQVRPAFVGDVGEAHAGLALPARRRHRVRRQRAQRTERERARHAPGRVQGRTSPVPLGAVPALPVRSWSRRANSARSLAASCSRPARE